MVIKVLGTGCTNCHRLEEATRRAVLELGVDAEVLAVRDLADIMAYGAMSMPALVIDEELRLAGRVPSVEELKRVIAKAG